MWSVVSGLWCVCVCDPQQNGNFSQRFEGGDSVESFDGDGPILRERRESEAKGREGLS